MDGDRGILDLLVGWVARGMSLLGLNGSRLLWRWNQRRRNLGEAGVRAEILVRSARGQHKMCPNCRALVPREARVCSECSSSLTHVAAPGVGRLFTNIFPGVTTATSLILLVNGLLLVVLLAIQIRATGGESGVLGGIFSSFDGRLLVRVGSGASGLTFAGEWWRLITPIFLHAGILHFAFNSYVLIQLGPLTESEFGTDRFWVLYLLCGISGSVASQALRPINTVGASGAIMGLMGLLLVHGWRRGGAFGEQLRQSMLRFALYTAIFSLFFPGIDHLNHLGGFLCGALLGLIVPSRAPRSAGTTAAWQLAALVGALLVVVSFAQVARHMSPR